MTGRRRIGRSWPSRVLTAAVLVGAVLVPGQAAAQVPTTAPAGDAAPTPAAVTGPSVAETSAAAEAAPVAGAPATQETTAAETPSDPAAWPGGVGAEAAPTAEAGTAAASSPIADKHAAMGGDAGVLGPAVDVEHCGLVGGGCYQDFMNGQIVWSPSTGARALTDTDISVEWALLDAEVGPGYPTSDTFCGLINGGCGQHFERQSIYSSHAGTWAVRTAMLPAWRSVNWEYGLGYPVDEEVCGLRDGGCLQEFELGAIYLSPRGGFVVKDGPVRDAWGTAHWEVGWLGYPTSNTFCDALHGCGQHFEHGSVYWSQQFGTSTLTRAVRDRWSREGWERSWLGWPMGSSFCGLRDGGCGQHFMGGSIYTTPRGTFTIANGMKDRWGAAGWENGSLGYATSDAFCDLAFGGCGQHFERGSVYAAFGIRRGHIVLAQVRDRWAAEGWERGPLGMPKGDTFCGLRDGGCGQHFERGAIYWSPATGAHAVVTPGRWLPDRVGRFWASAGWETGWLGYPTSEQFCGLREGGCGQHFQGGSVYAVGVRLDAVAVSGPIRDAWARQGWEGGRLGYPTAPAYGIPNGTAQSFQGGTIRVTNGRVTVTYR